MRRQDELICIYRGQPNLARKFLLSQMEELALAFDSEEVLAFLQGELSDPDPIVANQALYSLARFLPAYVQKRHTLAAQLEGVWSAAHRLDAVAPVEPPGEAPACDETLGKAALMALRPVAAGLIELLRSASGWTRTRAILTLGRFGLRAALFWLCDALSSRESGLEIGLSLACHAGPEIESRLLYTLRRQGAASPDLYLLLSAFPSVPSLDMLTSGIDRTSPVGRMNIARALATFDTLDIGPALDRLSRAESWVDVAVLNSLEILGRAVHLPRVIQSYRRAAQTLVKLQAVRAAGGIASAESIGFCLDVARTGCEPSRAVALESLVRLGADAGAIHEVAGPLLSSSNLKARVNAILAVLSPDEVLESPVFKELLLSRRALDRVEAAYCLGYLQSSEALSHLSTLAARDPVPGVRFQAIKSLSRYPAQQSMPVLVPLIGHPESRVALTVGRVLGRYGLEDAKVACEILRTALKQTSRPFERALLYRAYGAVAGRSGHPGALEVLAGGLDETDPLVLSGVVEGWNLVEIDVPSEVTQRLGEIARSSEPRLRARALLALWHMGELEAPAALGRMVSGGNEKEIEPAIECALEIGLLLPCLAGRRRFARLARRLVSTTGTTSFQQFVDEEVDLGDSLSVQAFRLSPEEAFKIRRQLRIASRTAAGGAPAARPAAGPADPQRARPADRPIDEQGAAEELKDGLLKAACLIAEDSSHGPRVLRGTLALAIAVLILVAALGRPAVKPAPVDRRFPGHLWVHLVQPPARGPSGPLALQDVVKTGQTVTTGNTGELVLATPSGNLVKMQPESSLALEAVTVGAGAAASVYRFADLQGTVQFEFRRGAELIVRCRAVTLSTSGAVISIQNDRSARTLTVRSGRVSCTDKRGSLQLRAGESLAFD